MFISRRALCAAALAFVIGFIAGGVSLYRWGPDNEQAQAPRPDREVVVVEKVVVKTVTVPAEKPVPVYAGLDPVESRKEKQAERIFFTDENDESGNAPNSGLIGEGNTLRSILESWDPPLGSGLLTVIQNSSRLDLTGLLMP